MLLAILMGVFGVVALSKGEFKITGKRKVKGSVGRNLGIALLIGAAGAFVPDIGGAIQFVVLVAVIIIGLATSEKIETPAQEIDSE